MILFACVDECGGMLFGGRRQSKDRLLRAHLLAACEGRRLFMSSYSASQFEEGTLLCADDDYVSNAQAGDACFVEDGIVPNAPIQTIVLYRWNRHYPADTYFPFDPLERGYRLVSSEDFVGSSHERITADRFEKEVSAT